MQIRIGTRASALARWQADWVAGQLNRSGVEVELVLISTQGDRRQDTVAAIGSPGIFTKEIQRALLDSRIDVTVHSLKDLPTDETPGLALSAVPPRAAVWDCLVGPPGTLDALPQAATVGTGSLRRRAQLLHVRPDLRMRDLRGNVETRLRKLSEGQCDAVILAQAGLERLGLASQIAQVLPPEILLPAVGQGALGLETRRDDAATRQIVETLNDPATKTAVLAERALLAALRGGCLAPIAAWGRMEGDQLALTGRVLSVDGRQRLEASAQGNPRDAVLLGGRVAEDLCRQGAAELIEAARVDQPPTAKPGGTP